MNDDTRENGDSNEAHTEEAALSARLRRLGEGLGQAQERAVKPSASAGGDRAAPASGYARGLRLSSELVGGVLLGAGLGWLVDRLLGISPWGFIVFLLLGFAAGVLNVMRSAGVIPGATPGDAPPADRNH
jgi:ATP synthase protein I